jgi:hypothetical protein
MTSTSSFLPSGNILCPVGGCRVFDPRNFTGGTDGFVAIIVNIASIATFVLGALAVLFVIYGAFLFLIGGEKGHEKGRKVIVNAIIAVVIASLSFTGVQLLVNVLNDFRF